MSLIRITTLLGQRQKPGKLSYAQEVSGLRGSKRKKLCACGLPRIDFSIPPGANWKKVSARREGEFYGSVRYIKIPGHVFDHIACDGRWCDRLLGDSESRVAGSRISSIVRAAG